MFLAMLSPHGGRVSDAMAAEYLDALRSEPEWAIARACEDFRSGRRGDGKFAPFPGELRNAAEAIRLEASKDLSRRDAERREVQQRLEWQARRANPDKESQERVKALGERVKQAIAAARMTDLQAEARRAREMENMAHLHARFDPESAFGGKWDLPMSEADYRAAIDAMPMASETDRQMREAAERARKGRAAA